MSMRLETAEIQANKTAFVVQSQFNLVNFQRVWNCAQSGPQTGTAGSRDRSADHSATLFTVNR